MWGVVVVLSFNLFFEKNNLTLGRLGIGKFLEGPEKGEEYNHNMFRFKTVLNNKKDNEAVGKATGEFFGDSAPLELSILSHTQSLIHFWK